jgi:hypothetical protein
MSSSAVLEDDVPRHILLASSHPAIHPAIEDEIANKTPRSVFLIYPHLSRGGGSPHPELDILECAQLGNLPVYSHWEIRLGQLANGGTLGLVTCVLYDGPSST